MAETEHIKEKEYIPFIAVIDKESNRKAERVVVFKVLCFSTCFLYRSILRVQGSEGGDVFSCLTKEEGNFCALCGKFHS